MHIDALFSSCMFWSFVTAVGITRLRLDLLWPIAVEIPKFRFFPVTVATKLPYLLQKGSKVLVTKDRCRSNSSGQCLLPRVTLEFIRILLSFLEFIRILQDIPSLASAAFCQIEVTVRLKSPKPWCCWTVANRRQFVTYVQTFCSTNNGRLIDNCMCVSSECSRF